MVIILGLGFTGQRLARRLLREGVQTYGAVRDVKRFRDLADAGLALSELRLDCPGVPALPKQAILVNLIPPLTEPENTGLRATIEELEPRRIVYVSSTGVYGDQVDVSAKTPVQPNDDRGRRRLEEERRVMRWPSLILRAAAIYGPNRGVHAAMRGGKMPRSAGSGIVSRIHVEDLAAIIQAGIFSDLEGAWPVADEDPCSSAEIAVWCSKVLKMAELPLIVDERGIAGRRVDGTEIREKLGIKLAYPSWRAGVPASLAEENG
jgi:nucleoside-diphosphate-sugar epimerase